MYMHFEYDFACMHILCVCMYLYMYVGLCVYVFIYVSTSILQFFMEQSATEVFFTGFLFY